MLLPQLRRLRSTWLFKCGPHQCSSQTSLLPQMVSMRTNLCVWPDVACIRWQRSAAVVVVDKIQTLHCQPQLNAHVLSGSQSLAVGRDQLLLLHMVVMLQIGSWQLALSEGGSSAAGASLPERTAQWCRFASCCCSLRLDPMPCNG